MLLASWIRTIAGYAAHCGAAPLALTAGLIVVGLANAIVTSARPLACSAGPDDDPVASSDVIVAGRIADWTIWRDADPPPPAGTKAPDRSPYAQVRISLEQTAFLKGALPAGARIIDAASLYHTPATTGADAGYDWHGSAGSCGAFDEDPTGKYAVLGLRRADDATYRISGPTTFYLSREPYDLDVLQRRDARLRRLSLPEAGVAPPIIARSSRPELIELSLLFAGVELAAAGARLRQRSRLHGRLANYRLNGQPANRRGPPTA